MEIFGREASSVLLIFVRFDIQIKFLSSQLLIDLEDVLGGHFEVTRRIVGLCNPQIANGAAFEGFVNGRNAHKHIKDWAKQLNGFLDLLLRRRRLNHRRHHGNVVALSANLVRI